MPRGLSCYPWGSLCTRNGISILFLFKGGIFSGDNCYCILTRDIHMSLNHFYQAFGIVHYSWNVIKATRHLCCNIRPPWGSSQYHKPGLLWTWGLLWTDFAKSFSNHANAQKLFSVFGWRGPLTSRNMQGGSGFLLQPCITSILKGISWGLRCTIPIPMEAFNFWSHVPGIPLCGFGMVQCRITSLFNMIRSHNKIAA